MIQAFQSYIATNKLFTKQDKLLVAVSGGRDSMLLVDLLQQLGYDFGVAHVNYQLRGKDSMLDERFVSEYCEKHVIPLYVHRPDIQFFKKENGVSTQMAARTIRYEWFEEIVNGQRSMVNSEGPAAAPSIHHSPLTIHHSPFTFHH